MSNASTLLPKDSRTPLAKLVDMLVEQICRYSPAARSYRRTGPACDLLGWGRRCLPAYFRQPPSKMHLWLADRLDEASHSAAPG